MTESDLIRREIESRFGFFPPFFEPALDTPLVLKSLWQQTLTAYVENPLPALFKEKLAALLARYCSVPYCMICHSVSLRPLGLSADEVLRLLHTPLVDQEELRRQALALDTPQLGQEWPEAGSAREQAILNCCMAIFQSGDPDCQERLRSLMSPEQFSYLTLFLLYNRTCLSWAEANPGLSYQADQRVLDHLGPLLEEQPALADFFANYASLVREKERLRLEYLRLENRRLQTQEVRYAAVLDQAPVAIALLTGSEHRFEFFNRAYSELSGSRPLLGRTVREAFPELEGERFFTALDKVYRSGLAHREEEARIPLLRDGQLRETVQDFSYYPLRDGGGEIGGVIVVAHDVSATVAARATVENQEQWLRAVLDALPVGLVMAEPRSGRYLFANRFASEGFGLDVLSRQASERNWDVRDSQGQLMSDRDLPSQRAAGGEHLVNHQVALSSEKGQFALSVNTCTIPAMHGHESTVLVAFADVSGLKQVEQALRENETGLSVALDVSQTGYWSYDAPSGTIRLSQQLREDWGISDSLPVNTLESALSMIHQEDRSRVNESISASLRTQQPYRVEYRVTHGQTGDTVWIEARGRTVCDEFGQAVGLVGTSQNITELKRTQLLLEGSLARMRRLADSMPQIVWTARPDGCWDYTNQRCREYLGCDEPHLWLAYVHPEDRQRALDEWSDSLSRIQNYSSEFRLRRSDGCYRWHLVRAEPVREGAHLAAWYGTCTDVDEIRKLAEEVQVARLEAEHASQTKSAFLANMSHEIRTPLAAILGFAEILKDDTLENEERLEFLDTISRNGVALKRLLDDVLDLSKVEAGQIDPEILQFDLLELLGEVRGLFEEQVRAKGLDLKWKGLQRLPAQVSTDPTRLRQILINLIGNAVKFTSRGQVTVSLTLHNGLLRITICDTGVGLTPDQAERLFQPFSQGDASTTRRFGGTGLGLALSRKLARVLGGDVWLDSSDPGQGCCFVATVKAGAVRDAAPSQPEERSDADLGGLKVLLVEDTPDNQRMITHILHRAGAVVELAQDGQEGLEKALSGQFEVVLMDMQMPRLDGFTATRMLRQRGYTRPVLALTAHAMVEDRRRIAECGCDGHLTKPLNFDEVYSALNQIPRHGPEAS